MSDPRVFISVADQSGDQHAAALIRALKQRQPNIQVEGFGGEHMRNAGAHIHRETVKKAAMGLHGVTRTFAVMDMLNWLTRYYRDHPPHAHICIDSSSMNLPMAKVAHFAGVPTLYYICPQLWASRSHRITRLKTWVDEVACILPFEQTWYQRRGVNARFVGHPLFDVLPTDRQRPQRVGPPTEPAIVSIVPGSRRSEVRENLPRLLQVAGVIRNSFTDVRFLVPTTPGVDALVREMIGSDKAFDIQLGAFDECVRGSDLCLCKSGTSTLQAAAWGTPMIVVYYINPLLWRLIGRYVIKTPKIALVNILAGNRELVPEFVPWVGSTEPVAQLALRYLREPELRQRQTRALNELIQTLEKPGAADSTAALILDMVRRHQNSATIN